MAVQRFKIDGYGQIEPNHVIFTVTGRNESQCELDPSIDALENGMLVAVDKVNGLIKLPTENEKLPIALHYSSEEIYNQFTPGLKNFVVTPDGFAPRVGYLATGDIFTTNCICFDTTDFTDEETLVTALKNVKTTALYGGISTVGAIKIGKTEPTVGPVLEVVCYTDLPDGQAAVKFRVIK